MKITASIALITCGLLLGCGKSETVSTDTAVTETVAPAEIHEVPAVTESEGTEPAPEIEGESTAPQGQELKKN